MSGSQLKLNIAFFYVWHVFYLLMPFIRQYTFNFNWDWHTRASMQVYSRRILLYAYCDRRSYFCSMRLECEYHQLKKSDTRYYELGFDKIIKWYPLKKTQCVHLLCMLKCVVVCFIYSNLKFQSTFLRSFARTFCIESELRFYCTALSKELHLVGMQWTWNSIFLIAKAKATRTFLYHSRCLMSVNN